MTNEEFINEFDVLYNSITSNQAPGLNEYEKSVFLTKAQDEIVKSYFNPRNNKTQEGFDSNERRQIDFSMIMRSQSYKAISAIDDKSISISDAPDVINTLGELQPYIKPNENIENNRTPKYKINSDILPKLNPANFEVSISPLGPITISPFTESFFDMRDNTKSISIEPNLLMFINEYVTVTRGSNNTRLVVLPINYTEYSRIMNKPFKRPLRNQAWRLLDNSNGYKKAELIIGPNDDIDSYTVRYIKRPRAIRLIDFTNDNVTIDGESTIQSCELDPILHQEILQRAVELAKASYSGDLQSQIALGQASQTGIGIVQTASK